MRTIKFRGKRTNKDEWIYGYLADGNCICDWDNKERRSFEVKAKTIGQYTGLIDKNGNEIYEGDIVQSVRYKDFVYKVAYDQRFASFCLDREQDMYKHYFGEAVEAENCEVIGNIHDNPELLKHND